MSSSTTSSSPAAAAFFAAFQPLPPFGGAKNTSDALHQHVHFAVCMCGCGVCSVLGLFFNYSVVFMVKGVDIYCHIFSFSCHFTCFECVFHVFPLPFGGKGSVTLPALCHTPYAWWPVLTWVGCHRSCSHVSCSLFLCLNQATSSLLPFAFRSIIDIWYWGLKWRVFRTAVWRCQKSPEWRLFVTSEARDKINGTREFLAPHTRCEKQKPFQLELWTCLYIPENWKQLFFWETKQNTSLKTGELNYHRTTQLNSKLHTS